MAPALVLLPPPPPPSPVLLLLPGPVGEGWVGAGGVVGLGRVGVFVSSPAMPLLVSLMAMGVSERPVWPSYVVEASWAVDMLSELQK